MGIKHLRALPAVLGVVLLCSAAAPDEKQKADGVTLKVLLPETDATLHVDGVEIEGQGLERKTTVTPKKADRLEVTAAWKPNGYTEIRRSRSVALPKPAPRNDIVVDLREPDAKMPDKIEVIYVPTPDDVVEAMCKLAKVGPADIVYDLGCGDGRIVITAVGKHQAKRGVGVDLNADLIKECKRNATKAGVQDRVEFRQGDVLDIKDLSSASVVMLYMGEDINLRLKPILQKTLKPGARVVSHRFTMGDWKPARSEIVRRAEGDCDVHLWLVDATTSSLADGNYEEVRRAIVALEKQGATVAVNGAKVAITGGQVSADSLGLLQAFRELSDLELTGVVLTDKAVERIARLQSLRRLRAANTRIAEAGFKHLNVLTEMEGLYFPLTPIGDGGLEHLAGLHKLKELDLSLTAVTDAGLDAIKGMTGLQTLNLDGAKVSDNGLLRLKNMSKLETLTLCHTRVTDAGLAHLYGLTKLKLLNLRGTRTSADAVQALRRMLPGATILHAPNLFLEAPKE